MENPTSSGQTSLGRSRPCRPALFIYYTLTAYNNFIGTNFHKACYSVAAAVIIGVPENSAFSFGGGTQFVFTIRRINLFANVIA
jgi:hypothetical protein